MRQGIDEVIGSAGRHDVPSTGGAERFQRVAYATVMCEGGRHRGRGRRWRWSGGRAHVLRGVGASRWQRAAPRSMRSGTKAVRVWRQEA